MGLIKCPTCGTDLNDPPDGKCPHCRRHVEDVIKLASLKPMQKQVWVYKEGEKIGPFTLFELQMNLNDGSLLPSDLVWHEGLDNWIKATELDHIDYNEPRGDVRPPVISTDEQDDSGLIADYCLARAVWPYIWVGTCLIVVFLMNGVVYLLGKSALIVLPLLAFLSFLLDDLLWKLTERFSIRWKKGCQIAGILAFFLLIGGFFMALFGDPRWKVITALLGLLFGIGFFIFVVCILHSALQGIQRGWPLLRTGYSGPAKGKWIVGMGLCSFNTLPFVIAIAYAIYRAIF